MGNPLKTCRKCGQRGFGVGKGTKFTCSACRSQDLNKAWHYPIRHTRRMTGGWADVHEQNH